MGKVSQSKKEMLFKKIDILHGRLWELSDKMKLAGIPTGTRIQSAQREVESIKKWIEQN